MTEILSKCLRYAMVHVSNQFDPTLIQFHNRIEYGLPSNNVRIPFPHIQKDNMYDGKCLLVKQQCATSCLKKIQEIEKR